MDKDKTIQQLSEDFLNSLQITGNVQVVIDETSAFRVHIETEETGLLIGHHGRTLESFQMLLSIMASRLLGEWVKIYVNVNDYREKREETLHYMAQRAADQVVESGLPIELIRLTPSERRVIHLALSGDDRVTTESEGEGERRILKVLPKT
jgi:spoIIIJ-associated protein